MICTFKWSLLFNST